MPSWFSQIISMTDYSFIGTVEKFRGKGGYMLWYHYSMKLTITIVLTISLIFVTLAVPASSQAQEAPTASNTMVNFAEVIESISAGDHVSENTASLLTQEEAGNEAQVNQQLATQSIAQLQAQIEELQALIDFLQTEL